MALLKRKAGRQKRGDCVGSGGARANKKKYQFLKTKKNYSGVREASVQANVVDRRRRGGLSETSRQKQHWGNQWGAKEATLKAGSRLPRVKMEEPAKRW